MTTALTLTPINGEPRVHDLALAERLGFDRPRNIRNIIKRNMAKLLKFGVCSTVKQTHTEAGGRPAEEYYLNQKQAIFVCMKSETEQAFDVQVEIVHVFDAYLQRDDEIHHPRFRPEKTRKALPGGLTLEQQDAIKALIKSRVEVLPHEKQAKAAITCWSAIKSKFGVTYKEVPAEQFAEVLSLIARLELGAPEIKALPFHLHYPLESAAPPLGESGLRCQHFTEEKNWRDPGWELLLKLRDAGYNVEGPLYSHRAKLHIMAVLHDALTGKIIEQIRVLGISLPYAPIYLR